MSDAREATRKARERVRKHAATNLGNADIADRLWFKRVILDHIKRSRERDSNEQWCSSSGRITLIEERHYSPDKVSGYRISFDIGYVSASEAEKLLREEPKQ